MARARRINLGNIVYHALNRIHARVAVFTTPDDYLIFTRLLSEAAVRFDMRILAYCIMPNHWHLLLYPKEDGDLSSFIKYLTAVHTQRHHALRSSVGSGHIYQGRYKSFPVDTHAYMLQVCRYIERNPVRAKLVHRAEQWRWSSLQERLGMSEERLLSALPIDLPEKYLVWVNEPEPVEETASIRAHIIAKSKRGRPRKRA